MLELPKTETITVYYNWNLITFDADDNKFVDCAISGNAELIVTNDHHYKVLNKINFPKVNHIKLEEFFKTL